MGHKNKIISIDRKELAKIEGDIINTGFVDPKFINTKKKGR